MFPHRLADGRVRTVEVNSSSTDVEGRRLLFSIVQDVTAREDAHAALLHERERYLTLMSISQDGIHVLDEGGTLVEANPAFLRMLGRGRDAIGRLHVGDWVAQTPADVLVARVRSLIDQPGLFQARHRRADGTVFDVEVHAGGVVLDGQRFLLASSRDITARTELERQLLVHHAELEALNSSLAERVVQTVAELRAKDQLLIAQSRQAAMGEMIGNIAHQWRQPLNALALVLADLRDAHRFGELDGPFLEKAVADGNRLIQKMSSTINDFRDFLRPEKEKSSFSALAQVRETVELLAASFEHAGIALAVYAPADFRVFGFANEYAQVLMNLLSNAKQAIAGSAVANGQVTLRLEVRDGLGCLCVRDNGGGIPVAILDKIFEPYFSTKDGGTGIGLYMSQQIVERSLGGRFEVRNVDGGAEFVVLTPIDDGTRDPRDPPPATPDPS